MTATTVAGPKALRVHAWEGHHSSIKTDLYISTRKSNAHGPSSPYSIPPLIQVLNRREQICGDKADSNFLQDNYEEKRDDLDFREMRMNAWL